MISGDVRRSQSATFFKSSKKNEEVIQRKPKRSREETINTPEIRIEAASTATLTEEVVNANPNYLLTETQKERSTNFLAIKLNRLKDKNLRYESHLEFLSSCISDGLIPKGLELMLEPTIGNHDQQFLDNWYSKLKEFSLSLMKDIVSFCEKTIKSTTNDINNTEASLKNLTSQQQFDEIQTEISKNESSAKKILKQKKFKKYNHLKHKPKTTTAVQNIDEVPFQEENPRKHLYSDILKRKKSNSKISKKPSETKLESSKPTSTIEKLRSLNANNNRGKPPSRSNSSTTQNNDENLQNQVKQLQHEIQTLKQTPKNETLPSRNNSSTSQNNVEPLQNQIRQLQEEIKALKQSSKEGKQDTENALPNQKNYQTASNPTGGQTNNIEIINVITYIEQTMQTLKSFGEQLKIQLDTNLTQ